MHVVTSWIGLAHSHHAYSSPPWGSVHSLLSFSPLLGRNLYSMCWWTMRKWVRCTTKKATSKCRFVYLTIFHGNGLEIQRYNNNLFKLGNLCVCVCVLYPDNGSGLAYWLRASHSQTHLPSLSAGLPSVHFHPEQSKKAHFPCTDVTFGVRRHLFRRQLKERKNLGSFHLPLALFTTVT